MDDGVTLQRPRSASSEARAEMVLRRARKARAKIIAAHRSARRARREADDRTAAGRPEPRRDPA